MRPTPALLRACGRGNRLACTVARRINVMYAGAVFTFAQANKDKDNPNKMPFKGVLLLTDVASDKPPHGSEGHRIYVSKKAALEALPGLIGQAINYQPDGLDAHASRHKVGVITKAKMDGNKVVVEGQIWVHDFPEAQVLKNRSDLGMSMELAQVYVQDEDADVWNLEKFDFTGGTILKKNAAAYTKTDLAAQAATRKGEPMKPDKDKKHKVAAAHRDTGQGSLALMTQAITSSLGSAVTNALAPVVTEIKAANERFMEGLEEIKGLHLIQAAAQTEADEDEDDDSIVVHAAHDDASASASASEMDASASASRSASVAAARRAAGDDDDDDENDADDSSSSSSASATDVDAMEDLSLEDASQEPGEVNKDASNRGSKTSVTKPPKQGERFKGNVATGRLHAKEDKVKKLFPNLKGGKVTASTIQAAALIGDLQASVRQMKREMRAQAQEHANEVVKLRKQLKRVTAQAARFAELEGRHSSMSNELVSLGEKVGVDFNEVRLSGSKLTVKAMDQILAAAEQSGIMLNPQQRITMKMLAEQEGLLDEGVVNRMGRA